jgi:hypothetical protein
MICTAIASSALTSIQIRLGASSLQRVRCSVSFLALGQGNCRKAF